MMQPADRARLSGAPFGQILATVREQLASETAAAERPARDLQQGGFLDEGWMRSVIEALASQAAHLIRNGSRERIDRAACELAEFVDSEAGRLLAHRQPADAGALAGIARILSAAGTAGNERTEALLARQDGYAWKVLRQFERQRTEALPETTLREALDISETEFAQLLAVMEDADLCFRAREPREQTIRVFLGPAGRAAIQRDQVSRFRVTRLGWR